MVGALATELLETAAPGPLREFAFGDDAAGGTMPIGRVKGIAQRKEWTLN